MAESNANLTQVVHKNTKLVSVVLLSNNWSIYSLTHSLPVVVIPCRVRALLNKKHLI
jgi:hypothetical protein